VGILNKGLSTTDLATNSFGQNFTTSMIQIISGFSSLVNGGYYYQPHIVKQIQNPGGATLQNFDKILVKESVSGETSKFIRNAMYQTVEEGTATKAQVPGYKVGGKTGTAQKIPRADRTYVVSFLGCVPADNPQMAIYVVIDEPQNVVEQTSSIATQLAGEILKDVLPFLEIYPTEAGEGVDLNAVSPLLPSSGTQNNPDKDVAGESGKSDEEEVQNSKDDASNGENGEQSNGNSEENQGGNSEAQSGEGDNANGSGQKFIPGEDEEVNSDTIPENLEQETQSEETN